MMIMQSLPQARRRGLVHGTRGIRIPVYLVLNQIMELPTYLVFVITDRAR